jgi:NitT/TauT family transport system substrate-binding protein
MAMQQRQEGYEAIAVWNPFVLETLKKRDDVKVLFDSTTIPGEIVDMIVVSQDALDRPGGDRFASVILDTFYAINGRMADPATADETLVALGEKFSNLDLESMKTVVKQTEFYATAVEAVALFEGEQLPAVMKTVTAFCESHEIVEKAPVVGFGSKESAPDADFRIDATYLKHFSAP